MSPLRNPQLPPLVVRRRNVAPTEAQLDRVAKLLLVALDNVRRKRERDRP